MTDLGKPSFGLHPLHGLHEPTTANPARRPGSVRRTSSIDMTRAEGTVDPVHLEGRARDLLTADDGSVSVLGEAALSATIELVARVVRHVSVTPPAPGCRSCPGRRR